MIKKYLTTKFILVLLFGGFLLSTPAKAQLDEVQKFLEVARDAPDDVNKLTQAYLTPLPTGLSTTLNSGWTNKAAPTKTLGFSLQIRGAVATVPSGSQSFDASALGLNPNINVSAGESSTLSGSKGSGQTLTLPGGTSIEMPGGTGFQYVPMPIVQANVGLIKKTDITIRFVPETDIGDFGTISLIGGAVKHDIAQWLPGSKLLPVDISVLAGFTSISMDANLSFGVNPTGQKIETTTNSFVFNAYVGKTLPFLSAYAGVGYQTGTFEFNMLGDYTLQGQGAAPDLTLTDPVSYEADSDASLHALGGVQFKLAIFRIYLEATAANYFTVNGGIGIGFRN